MSKFKNTLIIEIDSESEPNIIISKPEKTKKPETVQETIDMMSLDFKSLCVAICEMTYVGHINKYFDGNSVLDNCIEELQKYKENLNELTKEE